MITIKKEIDHYDLARMFDIEEVSAEALESYIEQVYYNEPVDITHWGDNMSEYTDSEFLDMYLDIDTPNEIINKFNLDEEDWEDMEEDEQVDYLIEYLRDWTYEGLWFLRTRYGVLAF